MWRKTHNFIGKTNRPAREKDRRMRWRTCKPRNYCEFCKSRFIGAFLPSMGAQYILLDLFGGPLIFTSANDSNMPIIKDEEDMFEMMDREPLIAEAFYNERKIRVSVDDSVVRVIDDQPQMIRRSKGYAPVPLYVEGSGGADICCRSAAEEFIQL